MSVLIVKYRMISKLSIMWSGVAACLRLMWLTFVFAGKKLVNPQGRYQPFSRHSEYMESNVKLI